MENPKRLTSIHMKRWITAIIAIPILFGIIAYGGKEAFAILIIVASLAGMYEYNGMMFDKGFSLEKMETLIAALLILLTSFYTNMPLIVAVLTFSVMTVMMLDLLRIKKNGLDMSHAGRVILGILYIPLLMAHFILLYPTQSGVLWIFFILVMAFAGDTAAYYIGRRLGKRKLLPEISPGKTVEGTIGLVVGSIAGCIFFKLFFFPMLPVAHAAVLGLVGSIIGQLGDLSESALKRVAGVKDSGRLLPGHGGILDRMDCLMFITPYVYYYQKFLI
jgi:phosphatidate cytidylyltransferase